MRALANAHEDWRKDGSYTVRSDITDLQLYIELARCVSLLTVHSLSSLETLLSFATELSQRPG